MSFALSLCATGQISVNKNQFPVLAEKGDTLHFCADAWVETPESEMNQRGEIMKLEKRIDKVLKILHKKKGYEIQVDSLITYTKNIEHQKDSLLSVINHTKWQITKKVEQRINELNKDISEVETKYFDMRLKRNLWRRNTFISVGLNVLVLVLLL